LRTLYETLNLLKERDETGNLRSCGSPTGL
jgi:hypothetical protein